MHVGSETSHLVLMCQSVVNASELQATMQSLSTDVLTNLSMHCTLLRRNIKTTDVTQHWPPRCWKTLNSAFQEKPLLRPSCDACRHGRKTAQEPEEEPELHIKKAPRSECDRATWNVPEKKTRVWGCLLWKVFGDFLGQRASRSHVVMINIIPIACQWF